MTPTTGQDVKLVVAETKLQFAGAIVQMLMSQQGGGAGTSAFTTPGTSTPVNPFAKFFEMAE